MLYQRWSNELGLATSPLFGRGGGAHTAMLDGVTGSFVLSDAGMGDFDPAAIDHGPSWSWSSMMRHHVLVRDDVVTVAPANGGTVELIAKAAVDAGLERFLRFLEERAGTPTLADRHRQACTAQSASTTRVGGKRDHPSGRRGRRACVAL